MLELSPVELHILATGGSDGIKLWNMYQIAPPALILTEAPATSLLWSPFRTKFMATYGDHVMVWKVTEEDEARGVNRIILLFQPAASMPSSRLLGQVGRTPITLLFILPMGKMGNH